MLFISMFVQLTCTFFDEALNSIVSSLLVYMLNFTFWTVWNLHGTFHKYTVSMQSLQSSYCTIIDGLGHLHLQLIENIIWRLSKLSWAVSFWLRFPWLNQFNFKVGNLKVTSALFWKYLNRGPIGKVPLTGMIDYLSHYWRT